METISLERSVLSGLIASAVALVLLGGIAWQGEIKADEASSQAAHAYRVSTTVEKIMFDMMRAEAAQHGFEFYGEEKYLKSRDESLLGVVKSVDEAEQMVLVPEQRESLRQLKNLIAARMKDFPVKYERHEKNAAPQEDSGVAYFSHPHSKRAISYPQNRARDRKLWRGSYTGKSSSVNSADLATGSNPDFPVMSRIHQTIGQIVEAENSTLLKRRQESAFQRKAGLMSFSLLGMILCASWFYLFLRIRRDMRRLRNGAMLPGDAKPADESRVELEWLAHLSHELRTSINSIMGFSELLKEGRVGVLSKSQAEYIRDIHSGGQHMLAMVNNILDLSKVVAGKMTVELKPVEIMELLDNSIFIIKKQIASKHVSLHLDVPPGLPDINLDALKIRQILHNLLSNAVKFSPDGGQIKLAVRRVPRVEVGQLSWYWASRLFPLPDSQFREFLEISIADNGIGIPHEGLERLFQAYSRIDDGSANRFEGTGLGLMLVRKMAELHGGTVAVQSAEGKGSRFIVWLPYRTESKVILLPGNQRQQELVSGDFIRQCQSGSGRLNQIRQQLAQQRSFIHV